MISGERFRIAGYWQGTNKTDNGHEYIRYKRGYICNSHFLVNGLDPSYDLCPNCYYRAKKTK